MGNSLIATSALAFAGALAAGPALAADKLSVGVGGYMQQWFGMSSVDDNKGHPKTGEKVMDGAAQQSDSEIFFKGKLEADNGLSFSVKVELEGNNAKHSHDDDTDGGKAAQGVIDESQLTVGGSFGQIVLGAEDPASTLMHYGAMDVGISLNCGDTHKWIGGLAGCSHNGFGTYGHGHGDKNQLSYFSPRMNGVQIGATYIPDTGQEGNNEPLENNDESGWAVGANYKGEFGDGLSLAFSLGHYQGSQVGAEETIFDGMMHPADGSPTPSTYTASQHAADEAAIDAYEMALAAETASTNAAPTQLRALRDGAAAAKSQIARHETTITTMADDRTFSNVGLQVGMGAFTFTVAYATMDGGAYKVVPMNKEPATPTPDNPDDDIVMEKVVEDDSKSWDTYGTGVKYTDGPMAFSLSHLATEWDDGGEQAATMLSASYTLAPGVASKTSVFMAERDWANGRSVEGTGFVTGITIGF